MKKEEKNNILKTHLIYRGPAVNEGRVEINDLLESLKAFSSIFNYFKKELKVKEELIVKVGDIKKGSSDVNIYIQLAQTAQVIIENPASQMLMYSTIAKQFGIFEITKPIFKHFGELIVYKLFAKNKPVEINTQKTKSINGEICTEFINAEGEKRMFSLDIKKHAEKVKGLDKVFLVKPEMIDEVEFVVESEKEKLEVGKINKENYQYLKYMPAVDEKDDILNAKVRYVDNKTGNGKLWLDENMSESIPFEVELKDISELDNLVRLLALSEGNNEWLVLTGKKEFENGKLKKFIVYKAQKASDNLFKDYE